MKITINGVYENYPVTLETESPLASVPGLIQELLDAGITPPESLSEFVQQVDARNGKPDNRQLATGNQPPTNHAAPVCPVHQSPMRPGNKGGWFCSRRNPNGEWCDQRVTGKKVQPQQPSFVTEQPVNQHGF